MFANSTRRTWAHKCSLMFVFAEIFALECRWWWKAAGGDPQKLSLLVVQPGRIENHRNSNTARSHEKLPAASWMLKAEPIAPVRSAPTTQPTAALPF